MLRRDIQDKKSDSPEITAEYLKDLIDAYHAEKIKDGILGREVFASQTMRELERFYQSLPEKTGILKKEEIFSLCRIIFSSNKKGPKTKQLIDTLLLAYFDPNIVATLDSVVARTGTLNFKDDILENIFKNPTDAAVIAEQRLLEEKNITRERMKGIPFITGEYLKQLIEHYHLEKIQDNCFGIEFFVSPTMRELDRFYYLELGKKTGRLTNKEVIDLCKIIFSNNKLTEKTKHAIDNLLRAAFDPLIISALHSAVGRAGSLDIFENHLENIFNNPDIAATIVDTILILDHVVHHKLMTIDQQELLYSKKLLDQLIQDPTLAIDILNLHRLANDPKANLERPKAATINSLDTLFAKDALFFISLKLYQSEKLSAEKIFEKIKSLLDCSKIALRAIAEQVAMSPDPLEPVDLYLSRRTLPLCAIFSTSKAMEERRLEYLKLAEEKLEEKSNKSDALKEELVEKDETVSRKMSFSSIEV